MDQFIVATDSGCDLPPELLEKNKIAAIMLHYDMNGESFEDNASAEERKEFYEKMRRGTTPKTTQINETRFEEFFRGLKKDCPDLPIVYIGLGGALSGTCRNAQKAAEKLNAEETTNAKIYAIDSTQCSAGYGLLALTAARLRDGGKSAEECVNFIEEHKIRLNALCTTDDLTYLRRSGRCSFAAALIGGILKICPVLTLDGEGNLGVRKRVRGYQNTVKEMFTLVKETAENAGEQTLYISHSDVEERAKEFGEALKKEAGFKDVFYTEIGTVIGSHCGPGVIAAFYYGKPRK